MAEARANDLSELVSDLRSHGATVQVGGMVRQILPATSGRLLKVNGRDVQVLIFAGTKAASALAARVSLDGYSVNIPNGVSHVDWTATPHLYRKGSRIVVYAGEDPATKRLLSLVLGSQFSGGD